MTPIIGDLKFQGVELEYELSLEFRIGDSGVCVQIRYKEDPSSHGYRGWRTLESLVTSQYWINEERGFSDYYILWYLKDTFKTDFPNNKLSVEEIEKLFAEVLVELKKIMHERKIEIPGYTIETGD